MTAQLTLATWSSIGVMKSSTHLGSILDFKQMHIIGLSEHWLCLANMHFLEIMHSGFIGFVVPDNY